MALLLGAGTVVACIVPQLNTLRGQSPGIRSFSHIDKCILQGERIARVTILVVTLPHGQPHAVFRGIVSVAGAWMLING